MWYVHMRVMYMYVYIIHTCSVRALMCGYRCIYTCINIYKYEGQTSMLGIFSIADRLIFLGMVSTTESRARHLIWLAGQ